MQLVYFSILIPQIDANGYFLAIVKNLNESCTSDYECNQESELVCTAGNCQCPSGGSWFW